MIREVCKFGIIVVITIMAFAVAMHSILQESANSPETYARAKNSQLLWTSEYEDITSSCKTLARAAVGDFSADFSHSDYSSQALFGLGTFILLMLLMLMNLLITLLMAVPHAAAQPIVEQQPTGSIPTVTGTVAGIPVTVNSDQDQDFVRTLIFYQAP